MLSFPAIAGTGFFAGEHEVRINEVYPPLANVQVLFRFIDGWNATNEFISPDLAALAADGLVFFEPR